MVGWQPRGGLALPLLLLATLWSGADGSCLQDSIDSEGFTTLSFSGGNYDPATLTLENCKSACADMGAVEAAVEAGAACLCGTDGQLSGLSDGGTCTALCPGDSGECGGPDGKITGQPFPMKGAPIALNPVTSPATAAVTSVEVAGSTDADVTEFLVGLGDGSPVFALAGTTASPSGTEFSTSVDYMAPGTYTLFVVSSSAANNTQVTVQSKPLLLKLDCPPLVQPAESYHCTAIIGGSGLVLTATFDAPGSSVMTLSPPETPWERLGHPPPRGTARQPVQMAGGEKTFRLAQPFTQRTMLMALHWHGAGLGDCELMLMEGSCSGGGQVFCPSSGQCATHCPLVTGTSHYSCDASEPVFCPFAGQCSKSDGTCADRSAPTLTATKETPVPFSTAADTYGKILPEQEVWAEPGWFAQITCSTGAVSWISVPAGQGDVGATADDKQYMIELVGLPQTAIGIGHTCSAMSDITLTVEDGDSTSLTNTTSCQIPVGAIAIELEQNGALVTAEDTPPTSELFSGAFFVASNVDVKFKVTVEKGAPVLLEYDFDKSSSGVDSYTEDIPRSVGPSDVFTHTVSFASSGTFTVRVTGTNKHSLPGQPAYSTVTVTVQHPVTADWQRQLGDSSNFLAVVTGTKQPADVVLEMRLPSTSQLPTDASMTIDFGDGYTPVQTLLSDSPNNLADNTPTTSALDGFFTATSSHGYERSGKFSIQITMKNRISEETFSIEVEIQEKIIGLVVEVLQNWDDKSNELLNGIGKDKNGYRNDRNLTIGFKADQGTIIKGTLYNNSNGDLVEITSHTFVNSSKPVEETIVHHIDSNQEITLAFVAENAYETTEPSSVVIIILDPVTEISGAQLKMNDVQPENYQTKELTASWSTASTLELCLAIKYGETYLWVTYGDEAMCATKYPEAENMPTEVENPMTLKHFYWFKGQHNIQINVFNPKGDESYDLVVSVSEVACSNVILSVKGASEVREKAPTYLKSQKIVAEAHAEFTCAPSVTITKQWDVIALEMEGGEASYSVARLPDWDMTDLVIPINFLDPGHYILVYNMTMQNEGAEDGDKYVSQLKSYIQVERTPLYAGLIKGAVSKIVRGWSQTIILDAIAYSIDPDDTNSKEFTFQWYCRRLGEERDDALNATTPRQSLTDRETAPDPDQGGCFGLGPGQLEWDDGNLEINAEIMYQFKEDAIFIITVIVSKDVRSSIAEVQVEMSGGSPPLIEVRCADELLCSSSVDGVIANPQHNLGLRGGCLDGECPSPLSWSWLISKVGPGDAVTTVEDYENYLSATDLEEVLINKSLFSISPKFRISLEASDGVPGNKPGGVTYFVTVNQPPEVDGKLCKCESMNTTSVALIDTFSVQCQEPIDPEGFPVEIFKFFTIVEDQRKDLSCTTVPEFMTRLPPGVNQLYYIAEDQQGASAQKSICSITATMPTEEHFDALMDSKEVAGLPDSGDWRLAFSLMTARAGQYSTIDRAAMTEDERQQADVKEAGFLDKILETMLNKDVTKENIQLTASVLSDVASYGSGDALKLGMKTIQLIVKQLEKISKGIGNGGFPTATSMADVFQNAIKVESVVEEYLQRTTSESCGDISQVDFYTANALPVDTEPYEGKPKILSLEEELMCNVRDNARKETAALIKSLDKSIELCNLAAASRMVLTEGIEIETPQGGSIKTAVKKSIAGMNATIGKGAISFPPNMTVNSNGSVIVSARDSPTNSKTTSAGADGISATSSVIGLSLFDRSLQPLNVNNTSGILIEIAHSTTKRNSSNGTCLNCPPPPSKINPTEALRGKRIAIIYSTINITKPHSALGIVFTAYDGLVDDLFVIVSYGHMPTLRNYSLLRMLTDFPHEESLEPDDANATAKHRWLISEDWVDNRQGAVFIGVGQFNSSSPKYDEAMAIVRGGSGDFKKIRSNEVLRDAFTISMYQLLSFSSSCAFHDEELDTWSNMGVRVLEANLDSVTCNCSHLTSFASGLFVQPNTIDFAYVFANASFTDNLTIYMTLIILLIIYLLLLIWARWQDKKDIEKLGALPLPDNKTTNKYLYEIMLFTGHKADAATDSNVSFVLTGDDFDSGTRTFGKPKRRFFRKGGQDAFVMAVPCYLGDLKYIRIWHDNSGKGRFASWYLQYILVRNVQTGEMTTFVCNEWLAVEYNDGLIDRLIPVAGKEQMRDFATVFPHTSQQSLSDGHLWFSVFLRPPRSRFTRMQRVSCCFALLFLSMMVNAMWYERVPSKPSAGSIKFGPLSLSPEQIAVGVMSNIIVFVPSLLIVFLFRKSRPRNLRVSRIDKAMQKDKGKDSKQVNGTAGGEADDVSQDVTSGSRKASLASSTKSATSSKERTKKRRFTFPWWGVIIGWLLCIVCLFGSAFIVYSYGIMFGNEKTTKWVTSLFISLFSSILLLQPLKVFLSALVISAIFKNVDLGSDDANEDEQDPHLGSDEDWIMAPSEKTPVIGNPRSPYDKATLEKLRKQRLKEIEMGVIVREIISYSFFLWILFVLSFDNRDPNAFYLQKNLENAFIKIGDHTGFNTWLDFSKVSNTSAFWHWSRSVILQELRAQTWYDGKSPANGLRGFLDDHVNRIVGRASMRQVRSLSGTCSVHGGMRNVIDGCQGYTSIVSEDTDSYCANWTRSGGRADCNRKEYRYSSGGELMTLPIVAKQDVYGGGGYVFYLIGNKDDVLKRMTLLENENWIDSLTRAVFVEFSVYNAQVNLFGVATIFVEMTPGGGMHPMWRFDGVRLLKQAGSQAFVIICEILYLLFIIYFIVREVRLIRKQNKDYFKQYSSYAEWAIILLSFTGFIVYIMRYVETDSVLTKFKETYGSGKVKLNYALLLDDLYGYTVGIIVFIATLKFIKLLRFNRRIGMLSATLKQSWNDLTGFLVIFTIAIGSFGLLFNLLLVASMDEFKDWISAVEACFAMMLNRFEFMEMYRGSFLAAIMFFIFAIYMNLIFVNVLLTIILKGFEQVKNDVTKQPNDYEVVDFVLSRFKKFIGINSVTPLKDVVAEHQREQEESKEVRQLPDKVSTFIDQINHTYFEGKLNLNDKKMLKKTLRQAKHEQRGRPKSMDGFQRDENHMSEDQQLLDQL